MSSGPTVAIHALAALAEIAGLALVGRGEAPGWLACHWGGGHPVCAPRRLKPGPGPVWANLVAPCKCNPPITAPNVVSGSALPFAGNRPKCPRHPDMTMPPRAVRRGGIILGYGSVFGYGSMVLWPCRGLGWPAGPCPNGARSGWPVCVTTSANCSVRRRGSSTANKRCPTR